MKTIDSAEHPPESDPEDLTHPENVHDELGEIPILETDNLHETVLAAAALHTAESLPPEVNEVTANLTEWDSPVHEDGIQTPLRNEEDEESAAITLVESGVDEADREQRLVGETETEDEIPGM